jgi:glycosyltransferase involved in cell wall biosynthesis
LQAAVGEQTMMTIGQRPAASTFVTCIMPTAERRAFVPRAIAQFLAQDYEPRELLIVDDGRDRVEDLVPADPRVRYLRLDRHLVLGVKRNFACERARGDVIVHWDDDDWMAPWRISYQVRQLVEARADVCGLDRVLFYDYAVDQAWEYVYPPGAAPWLYGATLCYTKAFWRRNPFPPLSVGEDSRFVWANVPKRVRPLADRRFFVGIVHARNTSVKRTRGSRWRAYPAAAVHALFATGGRDRRAAPA